MIGKQTYTADPKLPVIKNFSLNLKIYPTQIPANNTPLYNVSLFIGWPVQTEGGFETFETLLSPAGGAAFKTPFPWCRCWCERKIRAMFANRGNRSPSSIMVDEKEATNDNLICRSFFLQMYGSFIVDCLIIWAPDYQSAQNLAAKCWIFAIFRDADIMFAGAGHFHFSLPVEKLYWRESAGGVSLLSSFNTGSPDWHLVFFIGGNTYLSSFPTFAHPPPLSYMFTYLLLQMIIQHDWNILCAPYNCSPPQKKRRKKREETKNKEEVPSMKNRNICIIFFVLRIMYHHNACKNALRGCSA